MLNCVQLCGRLCADPECRTTQGGKNVANFNLAVPKRYANPDATDTADFFACTVWGKEAEYVENYLTKGRLVALSGRLQTRKYTKGEETRTVTEIVVDSIHGLDRPKDAQPSEAPVAPASNLDDVDPFA